MSDVIKVFVSSVERELLNERLIVQNLMLTDDFLSSNVTPILYEHEPASPNTAYDECLDKLKHSHVCLLLVGSRYGSMTGDCSITHLEFRTACDQAIPLLTFIRGGRDVSREEGVSRLISEIEAHGSKYKRFDDVVQLQREVRAALVQLLKERYGREPSVGQQAIAAQTIESTSPFESNVVDRADWASLDLAVATSLRERLSGPSEGASQGLLASFLIGRGLAVHIEARLAPTSAGVVVLGARPSTYFPQCRMLLNAYSGEQRDASRMDTGVADAPLSTAVEEAVRFVIKNTRHPFQVVGLNRVQVDEYPTEAVREVIVNAVAHRDYADGSRKIILDVFRDRVVVSSPGTPPSPLTLASLRTGNYRPCSRNPLIASCLAAFDLMEERGSGFQRIRDRMLDHGLQVPTLSISDGYFHVSLYGPGEDLSILRVSPDRLRISPSLEARLSDRQRKIMETAVGGESVTTGWVIAEFAVARDTAHRDLKQLVNLGLLRLEGSGRSARYTLSDGDPP